MLFGKSNDTNRVLNIADKDMKLISESVLMDTLTPEELSQVCESVTVANSLVDDGIITEKSIMRMNAAKRLNRAFKTSVYTIARENADPLFGKLVTTWKMQRALECALAQKYSAEATRRTKLTIANMDTARARKSIGNSSVLATAIEKAKAQFNVR